VAYFVGIDGGGSKTSCLIGDESRVLGSATAGGSNVVRRGEEQAYEALHSVVRDACAAAQVEPSQITRTCIGAAGAGRAEVRDIVHRILAKLVAGGIEVVGDHEIALQAGFGDGPGVLVIAGTGSIAYGRNSQGHSVRAGGWGHAISDEGSGHWIGERAVAIAVREGEQTQDTCLLKLIAKSWGVSTHQQVVMAANGTPAPDFAALFPTVLQAAEKQNRHARVVLTQAGEELAALAKDVVDRAFAGVASVPVAMSGGVFAHSALVREVFYNTLSASHPAVRIDGTVVEPVQGALQRARKPPAS
jgi:N-acetylglucosamine kinase-like BadF-type ATPase